MQPRVLGDFHGDYRLRLRTTMDTAWSAVANEVGGCVGRRLTTGGEVGAVVAWRRLGFSIFRFFFYKH